MPLLKQGYVCFYDYQIEKMRGIKNKIFKNNCQNSEYEINYQK